MDLETIMAFFGFVVGMMALGYLFGFALIQTLHREEKQEVQIKTPTNNIWAVREAERIINEHLTKRGGRDEGRNQNLQGTKRD